MKRTMKNCISLLLLMVLCSLLLIQPAAAQEVTHKTVRVGYYPVANYQEVDEEGVRSGFSYDYLMQIQKYTRWNYEFVEASYADCLRMLLNGEIDIMSGLNYTDQRNEQMIFSKYSVSTSQNKFYAKEDNENLFYESYDAFDGGTIAMMRGMLHDEVNNYCERFGFSVNIKEYDSLNEMEAALMSGEVDLVCGSSITNSFHTKIVARMDRIPLYYVTSNYAPEIAKELDNALQKIVDNNPDFYAQMSQKYMISGVNATATFTREELDYIRSGEKVYVIVNSDWAPITWYDKKSGTYKGIFVDVLEKIKDYSGLDFVLCTEDEFNQMAADKPDMINHVLAILADDNSWAVQQSVMMTNHVVDSSVVMVTKRGSQYPDSSADSVIALPTKFYIGYAMRDELKGKNIACYDTVEQCLSAVNSGKADITYINELVATYYLSMLEYSELFATASSGYYENLSFAVNKDTDAPLLSILDKSLLCLGSNEIGEIVIQNSIAEQRFSLKGLYYSNPTAVIMTAVLTVISIFGIAIVIYYIISKKRQTERELQREFETGNARTEFFMMISHELRTPLNAIVGYLDLTAELCSQNGWDMEYIKRSQSAAKQLTDIAEDMLDYTRIASDTVELREEVFDLKDIILNADQNIRLYAEKKQLHYQFRINHLSHEYVVGDCLRVTQIFQQLLSNAVKFTAAGGMVEANVSEKIPDDKTIEVTLVCRDTGKGMSEEFLEKVCAPFNQSDNSYSRTHGGLGLGLYLTKYFVNAMKGSFQVESKLGEGSCFTVVLPLKRPDSEQLLKNDIDCSHVRAIVGDANAEDHDQLKELLKRLKIKCDAVTEPEKLIRRIQSRMGSAYEYSLCIVDETMLGDVPFTILDAIHQLEHVPVIFVMTSKTQLIDLLAKDTRVCQILYKPIFQSVFFDAVMDTFGEYNAENETDEALHFHGIHAMIVEDNMINADILSRVLRKAEVEVTVCENGSIAVDTFEQQPENTYQIIFMDIQMPVMNGYTAAEHIRQSAKPQGKVIPIVAVSANAFSEDIEKSLQSGINEHLSKPINAAKIFAVIEKYCQ